VTPAAPSIDNADDASWDNLNNAEGDSVSVPVVASDPNNFRLSYSATGLPAGLAIDPDTGIISGVVTQGDDTGAAYDVVVSVSNGYKTTTLEFPWTIDKVALAGPADQTNTAGDSVNLAVGAQDLNGLALSYTASGLPDGLSIDPNSGVITGTVAASGADGIPWQVTVDATDGVETSEQTFNWTVLPSALPSLTLANPGSQVNATTDVISLPIQGQASGPDTLTYSVMGLPTGLDIDPSTGIISGMDDDFSAPSGSVYAVTVTVTDDYGQSTSQGFHWQFNASSAASSGSGGGGTVTSGGSSTDGVGAPGTGAPSARPSTESRDDNFSVDAFWQNVEKFPGGLAAEQWLASRNGQVQWAWLGITTDGQWTNQGTVPVVYIPQRYNEADAASAFVNNVNKDWVFGFASYSRVPTNGSPDDWQEYIKERTQAQGQVVVAGAELYLSGLSIASEGADFVVTLNDIATSKDMNSAAIAAVGILPFVSSGAIRIVQAGKTVLNITPNQRQVLDFFLMKVQNSGTNYKVSSSFAGGAAEIAAYFRGLKNVRNLAAAPIQFTNDTCGLFVSISLVTKLNPGKDILFGPLLTVIQSNKLKGNIGVNGDQLATYLRNNLTGIATVARQSRLSKANYQQLFAQGNVVALVDRGHWVQVSGIVQDGNDT